VHRVAVIEHANGQVIDVVSVKTSSVFFACAFSCESVFVSANADGHEGTVRLQRPSSCLEGRAMRRAMVPAVRDVS
jgi:hypothetical protein